MKDLYLTVMLSEDVMGNMNARRWLLKFVNVDVFVEAETVVKAALEAASEEITKDLKEDPWTWERLHGLR